MYSKFSPVYDSSHELLTFLATTTDECIEHESLQMLTECSSGADEMSETGFMRSVTLTSLR